MENKLKVSFLTSIFFKSLQLLFRLVILKVYFIYLDLLIRTYIFVYLKKLVDGGKNN